MSGMDHQARRSDSDFCLPVDGFSLDELTMRDPREFRLRYFIATLLMAMIAAATLRHTLHVYGGWTREGIRVEALTGATLIGGLAILFRQWSKRKSR